MTQANVVTDHKLPNMDGWILFNDTSAQFTPFSVLERLEIKPF